MPVSETRLAVRLQDNATSGLQGLTSAYNRFSNTVANSGNRLSQFNRQVVGTNMGGFANSADKAANSLKNMNQMMERLVYSASRYFVIYKALGAVGDVWDTIVGGSYEYAKSLETNQIGIAGILKSMITLNGEQVKWNDAMAISGKAMKGLQSEALRTAATSKELIETFRALLGPGLSSGMSIEQIVKLSTVGTNAVRSLGLPTNQYVQELRSIITEGIRPASSTLATSLGITNKDIKAAKQSAEGLYAFLMKRMEGFADAVKYTSGTVEGRIARIQEGLQVAGAKGAQELYKSWSNVLERLANYLIPVPEKLGEKWEINPNFVKSVENVAKTVGKVSEEIGKIGESIAPALGGIGGAGLSAIGQLADKLKYIAGFYAVKKTLPIVTDIANLATQSREAYSAETSLGRVLQGVNDKLHGRVDALRQATAEQKAYNVEMAKIRDIYAQQRLAERESKRQMAMSTQMAKWAENPAESWRAKNVTQLIGELRRLGVEQEKITILTRQYYDYVKTGSHAAADNIKQLIIEEERLYQAQLNINKGGASWVATAETMFSKAGSVASAFGGISLSAGVLCDLLGQADEKNKEWWESAGNAAMQAGMFATAIGGISSAIAGMIPSLIKGIEWLNRFATARSLAGLGLVGGVAAGVSAVVYAAKKRFDETGVASATDEWTGEEIRHDFGVGGVGEVGGYYDKNREINPEDRVEAHAWIDDDKLNAGNIAVKDFGGGAGGGSKGGGGAAKANKAEEYAARIKKHIEDLNKELTNLNGQSTAYEKTMATARDKIAGYEKDIVKAQQLGVDVGEIRSKQLEYQLAMEKKATEAQQDEYLKYMKLDEDAANRINIMGGTMEQQREVLAQRLETHRAYLEELLAAEIDNKERRASLEAELANVIKQINDNSVYEFKSGWQQALDEMANRQINFKDQFVSVFDSIEGSLVSFISSTGSAKDKFKQFCQDVTNTILKSMTQIIVKGLITKAIMAAIGLGGGSGVISDGSLLGSIKDSPYASLAGGFIGYTGARASGGNVKAGGTYLVGEQGPELVRFGSAGRVYNNNETKSMIGGGIENVKVEVINQSGQEVKANDASVRFDGKTMIISTVLEAVNNNTMGMRTVLKGVATT